MAPTASGKEGWLDMEKKRTMAHPSRMRPLLTLAAIAAMLLMAAMTMVLPNAAHAAGIDDDKIHWIHYKTQPSKAVPRDEVGVILYKNALTDSGKWTDSGSKDGVEWNSRLKSFIMTPGQDEGSFHFKVENAGRLVWEDKFVDVELSCSVKFNKAVPTSGSSGNFEGYVTVYNADNGAMGHANSGVSGLGQMQTWTVKVCEHGTSKEVTGKGKRFISFFKDLDIPEGSDNWNGEYCEGVELLGSNYVEEVWAGNKFPAGAEHLDQHGYSGPSKRLEVTTKDGHPWIHATHGCQGGTQYDSSFATLAQSGYKFTWRGMNCATSLGLFAWPDPEIRQIVKEPAYQEVPVGGTAKFDLKFRLPHAVNTEREQFEYVSVSDQLSACFDASRAV